MTLTAAQLQTFRETGLLRLKSFVAKKLAATVKDDIHAEFTRLNLKQGGKFNSSKFADLPVFQQIGKLSTMVKPGPNLVKLFDDVPKVLRELTDAVLKPASPPQLLLSFPAKLDWTLNNLNWHLDITPTRTPQMQGIQAFVLIDDLLPHGGATLAMTGSHRLRDAHAALRADAELGRLFTNDAPEDFPKPREIQGVKVAIAEMHGGAGDLYLMDMRVLHSPSINSTRNVRMMTTTRYVRLV